MKITKIEVAKLLDVVKANRQKHVEEFNEAFAGYREELIKNTQNTINKLPELHKTLEAQLVTVDINEISKAIYAIHPPHLDEPVSHENDYNVVIRKLELEADPIVELEPEEFQQFVMDNWKWKQAFIATSSVYNKK